MTTMVSRQAFDGAFEHAFPGQAGAGPPQNKRHAGVGPALRGVGHGRM